MSISEAELAAWLISNGLAESERGYGHACGEDMASQLLDTFDISYKGTDNG